MGGGKFTASYNKGQINIAKQISRRNLSPYARRANGNAPTSHTNNIRLVRAMARAVHTKK